MGNYVADFETTTKPDNCHVWAYGICKVEDSSNVIIGTNIHDFMKWCESEKNHKIYFHNLKFDAQFIVYWLFQNGFKHVTDKADVESKTFTTLISDMGLYYSVEVYFKKKGTNVNKVTFLDSLKLIPLSVDQIAKSFKLPMQKLEIDYKAHDELPEGSPLTNKEKQYLKHDVQIVAHALNYFFSQGLKKMTIGSCALDEYKKLIKNKYFNLYFPEPKFHDDVKQSYKGGFTYLNPKFKEKTVKNGIVLDVNSLYPSVMRYEVLPYGTPIFFKGKYKEDTLYCLYTQMFRCAFELKKDKIPTIQIKYGGYFSANEYLTTTDGAEVVLCLNSVDLKLFFEQYDVYNIEWISGWKFKGTRGLFDAYIDKWTENKINAKKEDNHGLYLIAKLFLNSLYGKFGTDTHVKSKIPYYDEESQSVQYKFGEDEKRPGVYVALASFITSYARLKTISAAQIITDNYNSGKSKIQFIYADTDSLHCVSPDFELPEGLDIDPYKLGAWKYEGRFNKGKYLRKKCYIENFSEDLESENPQFDLKVTVAGMPAYLHEQVNFKNFKIGATYSGKKQPRQVKGGVVLADVDFTIKA